MVKISTNVGDIQITGIKKDRNLPPSHHKIFIEHFGIAPRTYRVIEGIVNDPSQDLIINARFSNAKKNSLIFVALIDELGEYLSWETLEEIKKAISIDLRVAQEQVKSKKITLLVAKQQIGGSITNAKVYYLKIIHRAEIETRAERLQRG